MLSEAGLNDCVVVAGYQLSYPEQKIRSALILVPIYALAELKILVRNP